MGVVIICSSLIAAYVSNKSSSDCQYRRRAGGGLARTSRPEIGGQGVPLGTLGIRLSFDQSTGNGRTRGSPGDSGHGGSVFF